MKVFLDTSAFAKRYVVEQGTDALNDLWRKADGLFVSIMCLPELVSTLSRLVRAKKLGKPEYLKLKNQAMEDLQDMDICQITPSVLHTAVPLLQAYPLRCMDALHVACALTVASDAFVSADRRQLSAAKKSGLKIVDLS